MDHASRNSMLHIVSLDELMSQKNALMELLSRYEGSLVVTDNSTNDFSNSRGNNLGVNFVNYSVAGNMPIVF